MIPDTARANSARANSMGSNSNGRFQTEPTLGDLFSELSQETSTLVRQEVELAKAEITQKVAKAGKDLAFIIGGGLVGYIGAMALVAALIMGLSNWMAPWLAAFLVGAVLVAIAAALIISGLNDLQTIDPTPRRTVASLKEDKEWLTRQIQ